MTRNHARSQSGVTLIEAMITVFVLSLVLVGFYTSFDRAQRTSSQLDARLEHLGEGQKLIRTLSKDLRTATPLSSPGSPFVPPATVGAPRNARTHEVSFYARLDQGFTTTVGGTIAPPERVRLWVDSTNPKAPVLKEETKEADTPLTDPPTYSGPQPTKLRLIGTYIANTPSEPIFTYYGANGLEIVPSPVGSPLSDAQERLVRSIGISLRVKKSTALGVKPTAVESTVRLTNVIYGVAPGE